MNVRVASLAGLVYVIAIVVALFTSGLVPVLVVGALLVGLVYRMAAGNGGTTREPRQRNRNRNRKA
jgi:hypothetical protein